MNIKRFQKLSSLLSIAIRIICCAAVALSLISIIGTLINPGEFEIDSKNGDLLVYSTSVSQHSSDIDSALYPNMSNLAGSIVNTICSIFFAYLTWRITLIFADFSFDETPFSLKQTKRLEFVAKGYLVIGVAKPLLFSILYTFLIRGKGYDISLGVHYLFFVGLLLYVIADIFNYGIELQKLSDETI